MKKELIERLTRYVQVDTRSNPDSGTCPSTPGQLELGRMLVDELKAIGLTDAAMDDNGYVMATLPGNTDRSVPVIGFLAHLDTAADFTGKNVKPQIVEAYDGGDIVLNAEQGIVLSPRDFPELAGYRGHTLVTTDGTTLLGADNKAGIAIIMTAMHHLVRNPGIRRGAVRVAFTPDEEIGRGPHRFDVARFGAWAAYTVDGGPLGELQYESFNAAQAVIEIRGKNVHPGTAKGKMIHASKIAMEFHAKLPAEEAPEYTEGREGFYHLIRFEGDVEHARMQYIIRDFDREKFEDRKAYLAHVAAELQAAYGEERIRIEMNDQYYNMRDKIEPVREIIDIAEEAMRSLGIEPVIRPIRGGTDGSQLSCMGLPTPNLFTGGENFHGRYEYVSVDVMAKAAETVIEIVKRFAERDWPQ
ncbi:MAG: peptidase T [Thermobacillus sp.]|uniref:peptidase T n=1 Tax=Thermobacillus sp. TaxID=2108467 RepID=UPI000E385B19|nr:peptidase T [Thermobacillus sp.]REK58014.1 MAG: peptidase T [Thermobacillus sp.]